MEDSYRHKGLRRRLLQQLREKGIQDERVLDAMNRVPRHFFLDKAFEELAYRDKALPIELDQTISQPFTVAMQSSLLEVEKRQSVLEIGTGSGYQAAVLAHLGARVYTIERHEALHAKSKEMFRKLKLLGIRSYHRDGFKGLPELAPFHRILLTAAATEIPKSLLKQLHIGGLLLAPIGTPGEEQRMFRIRRTAKAQFEQEELGAFRFVPMLPGKTFRK